MDEQIKVLIFNENRKLHPYDPEIHKSKIFKFLYWDTPSGGIIVASVVTRMVHGMIKYLLVTYHSGTVPDRKPDGAGECGIPEEITSWESSGFEMTTPENLRPKITAALGM